MTLSAEASYFAGVPDLRPHVARIESPDHWRRINPHLTITDTPFDPRRTAYDFSSRDIERAPLQIREEGYLQSGPGVSAHDCQALSTAIARIIEARYHPMFLAVYDEYWRVLQGIAPLLTPILGARYRVLGDFWIWCIRDGLDSVHRRDTVERLHVLPLPSDPNVPDRLDVLEASNLQDVRALPAQAGSVLAWNQYILHWGGSASRWADGPRMSTGIYVQAGDVPLFTEKPVDFEQPLPFGKRLSLIAANMLLYQPEHRFPRELVEVALRAVKALANWEGMIPDSVFRPNA